jgi:hypothetical protein
VGGAGAVADTYELVRGFVRKLLRAANAQVDPGVAARLEPLCEAKADLDWHDAAARKAHLAELVDAVRELRAAVADLDDPAMVELVGLVDQVVDHDVEDDVDATPQLRQGVAKHRVISHSDPDMRHGRKSASRRFDGRKCDVVTDEDSELVLGVDVRAGNAGDGEGAAPLVEQVQHLDRVEVDLLVGDMAYSDGDVREAVEAHGVELVAKVPAMTNGGRYAKTDFVIDLDAGDHGVVVCPAGHTTSDAYEVKDHKRRPALRFVFDAEVCARCPLRARCVKGDGPRSVTVGPHERRIAAARALQAQPATKALLRRRAKVERKLSHLQQLGLRKTRYRGRRKTRVAGAAGSHRRELHPPGWPRRVRQRRWGRPGSLNTPTSARHSPSEPPQIAIRALQGAPAETTGPTPPADMADTHPQHQSPPPPLKPPLSADPHRAGAFPEFSGGS